MSIVHGFILILVLCAILMTMNIILFASSLIHHVGALFFAGGRKYRNTDPNSVFYHDRLGVI